MIEIVFQKGLIMAIYKSLVLSAVIAVLSVPIVSFAADEGKPMTGVMLHNGETGAVDHTPTKSTKTRAQVKKELDDAHKNGTHDMGSEATTVNQKVAGPGKSREQVKKELDDAHKSGTHDMGGEAPKMK